MRKIDKSKVPQNSQSNLDQALEDILNSSRKRQEANNAKRYSTESIIENHSRNHSCSEESQNLQISTNVFNFMDSVESISKEKSLNLKEMLLSKKDESPKSLSTEKSMNLKEILLLNVNNTPVEKSASFVTVSHEKSLSLKEILFGDTSIADLQQSKPKRKENPPSQKTSSKISNKNNSSKFASSKLLQSPDPVSMPMPDFDESFFS